MPSVFNEVGLSGGRVRIAMDNFEVATADYDADGDYISLCRLPVNARVLSIKLWADAMGTSSADVPFFVINLVMGLTPIRTTTYWWVSQLGMIPATAVYVYAGASFPSLAALAENGVGGILKPQLLIAFALLGLFPIIVKKGFALSKSRATV